MWLLIVRVRGKVLGRFRAGLVSGVCVLLLFMTVFGLVLNVPLVRGSGTIYIRADGSIDPPTAPISTVDNVTYTLTGNIATDADGIIVERDNIVVDGAGYTVQGTGASGSKGIDLSSRSNVTIRSMEINTFHYGIMLGSSSGNNIVGDNITNNVEGIRLYESSGNSMVGNNITANDGGDIVLGNSSNDNTISGNNITASWWYGIFLFDSSNDNTVSGNNITANSNYGIWLDGSSGNNIVGNNITNSLHGIYVSYSPSNRFYHNNFIDNTQQVNITSSYANTWDDGYSSGGNYWSDYTGVDLKSGSHQNETGSDEIGDTPYNQDNYPLMRPYVPFENQTIYIRADGSIDPSGVPIQRKGDLYFLTGNITSDADGIVIERDNVVIDGADYTIQGTGTGKGIALGARSNVTIRNAVVKKFFLGIELIRSTNNTICGNELTANNGEGIWLYDSSKDCSIHGNHMTNNSGSGIRFGWTGLYSGASNTSITGNWIAFNNDGGIRLSDSYNNSISGNNITNSYVGVQLYLCSNSNLVGNKITNNSVGVDLRYSLNNIITGNDITNNEQDGIYVYSSTDNDISKNRIATCDTGIHLLAGSSDNTISDNMIANNNYGFFLSSPFSSSQFTNHNSIVGNTITANYWGIALQNSSDNTIYHNFFTDNQNNVVLVIAAVNVWDSGYPSGGNYWSDYTDVDQFSGQYQNQTGSDGIWDHPYVIDENNIDNYPVVPEFPSLLLLPLFMLSTMLSVVLMQRKIPRKQKNSR